MGSWTQNLGSWPVAFKEQVFFFFYLFNFFKIIIIIFYVDHLKVFIEFVTIMLLFCVSGFWPQGMRDLCSPTWYGTTPLLWKCRVLITKLPGMSLNLFFFDVYWSILLVSSLMAQMVENLPAMRETRVWSLGRKDPLEEGMAAHSSVLPENSMDRGAWQATVHQVAKSQTWVRD